MITPVFSARSHKAAEPTPDVVPHPSAWWWLPIIASVCLISWLHFVASDRSIEWHEFLQRMYYVPIVIAALTYGAKGGWTVAGVSAALFLPHVFLRWHAWPIFQVSQYAEVMVFTLVASVTGVLTDRLRVQCARYQQTATERDDACLRLEAGIVDRLRGDRLITIGRIAAGMAHEIRNPLGALLGSIEVLGADVPAAHPKTEFLVMAKNEIGRLNRVVSEFLDFAYPPAPSTQPVDVRGLLETVIRLAMPAIELRGATIILDVAEASPVVYVDAHQVERAVLSLVLDETAVPLGAIVRIAVEESTPTARIIMSRSVAALEPAVDFNGMFEPFQSPSQNSGFALATARRLVENQGGTILAGVATGRLEYVIDLPLAFQPAGVSSLQPVNRTGNSRT